MRPVTSIDVARAAGVAQSTVSRALRDDPRIATATRSRIRQIADDMGYVPIERGRSLSTRLTHRVAIVCPDLSNPFYSELVEPLRRELARLGYSPMLIPERADGGTALNALSDGSFDAAILTAVKADERLPLLLTQRRIPVVLVNREITGAPVDTCVMDDYRGGAQVASLLSELGHRRLAIITGPASASTSRLREEGFVSYLTEAGHGPPDATIRPQDFAYRTGYEGMMSLLDRDQPPTGVFCLNDMTALGACGAAVARGLSVGRELSIIGFDDISMAGWDVFRLTTVKSDLEAMARVAVTLLMERVADPERPARRVVLPPRLVLRATHGPP